MIKYKCKTPTYQLNDNIGSIINEPIIKPEAITVNWKLKRIRVPFNMYVVNNNNEVPIPNVFGELNFSELHTESTVMYNGVETEVFQAMQNGWNYNVNEIKWGKAGYDRAMSFFEVTTNGLVFKDSPVVQLAKDYVLNNVLIEGKLLKENFELEEENF